MLATWEAAQQLNESCRIWKAQYSDLHALPAKEVLDRICAKWSIAVLVALSQHPHRFGELKRIIPKISQRMLTQTLRDLEQDGLINRKVYPTKPPSVEYSLTPIGKSLLVPLVVLANWADTHYNKILAARKRFIREGK